MTASNLLLCVCAGAMGAATVAPHKRYVAPRVAAVHRAAPVTPVAAVPCTPVAPAPAPSVGQPLNLLPPWFDDLPAAPPPPTGRPTLGVPPNLLPPVSDDMQVTPPPSAAVPEPETWTMLVIGFGAVGIGARRERVSA